MRLAEIAGVEAKAVSGYGGIRTRREHAPIMSNGGFMVIGHCNGKGKVGG